MKFYIETEAGQLKNHPAFEENLLQAFGTIPSHWVPFERVEMPTLGAYEVYEGVTYELVEGIYKDVHHVRSMTSEEITSKQQMTKDVWAVNGFASWVFNEAICSFEAPMPYPTDGKIYRWDEPTISWVEVNNA